MTTLAKIEANQRGNGQLSHGPWTPEGKAVVARNATTHGIFAAVPVLPGEYVDAWEARRTPGWLILSHRSGLLGEPRRARRACCCGSFSTLARYEAETVAETAMQNADLPDLPLVEGGFMPFDRSAKKTRDEQLADPAAQTTHGPPAVGRSWSGTRLLLHPA